MHVSTKQKYTIFIIKILRFVNFIRCLKHWEKKKVKELN